MNHPSTRTAKRLMFALAALPVFSFGDEPRGVPEQTEKGREQRLEAMRAQAAAFEVSFIEKGGEARLNSAPVFRYDDQPRGFVDATLWVWEVDGVPVAIGKVEDCLNISNGRPYWQYCFTSMSSGRIQVSHPDIEPWRANGPGLTFAEIPDGPVAASSPAARLRQMKSMAQRFSASLVRVKDKQEQRLLPTPVHRFIDKSSGVTDGAIFSLTTNGTSPTILLPIVLQQSNDESTTAWKYAIACMTADAATVRLDERTVWEKEMTYRPRTFFDTWFFYIRFKEPDKRDATGQAANGAIR